jgi:hypothetical protein
MSRSLILAGTAGMLLFAGCNQAFEPDGAYRPGLVVYGFLTTRSDTQYVRVTTNYSSPPGQEVTGAEVTVRTGDRLYQFGDTTVIRNDPAGKQALFRGYVCYGFHLEELTPYELTVTTKSGEHVSAKTISLQGGNVYIENPGALSVTAGSPDNISVLARLGSNARAYLIRFLIQYRVLVNGAWVVKRLEVPSSLREADGQPVYPGFISAGSDRFPGAPLRVRAPFSAAAYARTLAAISGSAPAGSVMVESANFVLTQLDEALFAYRVVAAGQTNSGSLRLDEPDYTNIPGGLGVFGCSSEQTSSVDLTQSPSSSSLLLE